jgi:two-component system, NarL family, invasion response regulator UvrY
MATVRIFVADDHPVITEGLTRYFATIDDIAMIGHCRDCAGLEAIDAASVDVLVLDVGMPGMLGAETVTRLRSRGHAILLFTLEPESPLVIGMLRAGAMGFVAKRESLDVLAEAIRSVARGARSVPEPLSALADDDGEGWPHEGLSTRERAVFDHMVRGIPLKSVAFDLGLSTSTVYTYAERVRRKLGAGSQAELVDYAHRAGLLGRRPVSAP